MKGGFQLTPSEPIPPHGAGSRRVSAFQGHGGLGGGHCISDNRASLSQSRCQLNPKYMPDIHLDPFPGCRVPKIHTIPALVETVSSRSRQKTHKPVTRCQLVEVNGTNRADDCVVGKWGPKGAKRLLSGWREGRWAWREHQQHLRPKCFCLGMWDLRLDF